MVARFLHCKVTISLLSTLYSWRKKNHYTHPKMSEKLYSTSLKGKNLHKLLEFLLHGDLSIFPVYLLSHLFISVRIYGYLFHSLSCNLMLFFYMFSNCLRLGFWELFLLVPLSLLFFNIPPITHHGSFLSFSFPPSFPPFLPLFLPFFFGTLHYFLAIQDPKDHLYFLP